MDPWQYNYMYHNFMDTVKFPAYFELFDGDKTAASLCGIGLSGYTGRQYNKKNYGLKFDSEYGAKSLDYQVFEDLDCSSFDSLVLRGGSNAEFSLPWKDEFASKLAQDCLLTKRSKTCALYINGIYKGIFNLREKVTPNMIAENFTQRSVQQMRRRVICRRHISERRSHHSVHMIPRIESASHD